MSEKELAVLDKIQIDFSSYYNDVEKFWFDFDANKIPEEEVSMRFFNLIEENITINKKLNEISLKKPKLLIKKAKEYSDNYFKQVF